VKLGFENKTQAMWAAALGIVAIAVLAYEGIPFFTGSSTSASSATTVATTPAASHAQTRGKGKKPRPENLDPTLRLDLLASSEKTQYEGSGRNIFVSQAEDIPAPVARANTDGTKPGEEHHIYEAPIVPPPPPIPLKFYGFANSPGEPKKIFLKYGEDVFVAGEGEIVDRRYKVIRISPTSVEIQDVVGSGPPQSIPLTQG
jgi:hypothetical protein